MEAKKQTRRTPSRDRDAELGRRAHMLMWDRRMKIKDAAASLEVDSTGLSKKLKGERGWALEEVVALADLLDTTVAYLVGETDEPGPRSTIDVFRDATETITNAPIDIRTRRAITPVEDVA